MNLFKQEENKPYTYSSIEMRKSSNKSFWMAIGAILLIVVVLLLFVI